MQVLLLSVLEIEQGRDADSVVWEGFMFTESAGYTEKADTENISQAGNYGGFEERVTH